MVVTYENEEIFKVVLVTHELLFICTTSAPLKCMFSIGNFIVAYNRVCPMPMNIEALVTMRCWFRLDKRWYNVILHDASNLDKVVVFMEDELMYH